MWRRSRSSPSYSRYGRQQACAETLRWKLSAGEVLHYTLEAKQVENIKVAGREKKSTRSNTLNLTWTVKNVASSGDAEITLAYDRVRMRIEQPPFMPIQFDSGPGKTEIPEEFEALQKQIKSLSGAEVSFTLRPTGEVDNLKISEKTIKALRSGLQQDQASQGAVSEQALKELLMQSSPPAFPTKSLEVGETWAAKPSKVTVPGLGTLKVDQVFTFQGADPKMPSWLLIGGETKATLEPAENVTARIRSQEGKANMTFDSQRGRIINSRNSQKMEMAISDRGQEIVQISDTTSLMTLEP